MNESSAPSAPAPVPAPTIAMRGGGYYSANTVGAKAVIDAAAEWVLDALAETDIPDAPVFAIADFGAADGGTSLDMMRRAVDFLRQRRSGKPVTITYTDLPDNDYSALFHHVLDGADALTSREGVHVFAAATSFHKRIFPAGSVAFGFSATAMHWLSRPPCLIPDHTHAVGATGAALAAYRARAAADWETILLHRAAELLPGGRLILVNFCIDAAGRYLGNTAGVNMHDAFNRHWRALRDAGTITAEEYERTNFQQFYRTEAEFRRPLETEGSAVRAAGLRLERCETRIVPCPYAAAFRHHRDPAKFAAAYVPTLRSWSEGVFLRGLSAERPEAERRGIVDRFYAAYAAEVAREPEGHAMDYVHCHMRIRKETAQN